MTSLPISTILGNLTLLEVYVKCNGARLLSCVNQKGQILLGLWVNEEVEFHLWLYILVSEQRLQDYFVVERILN